MKNKKERLSRARAWSGCGPHIAFDTNRCLAVMKRRLGVALKIQ